MKLEFDKSRDYREIFSTPIGVIPVPGADELMPKIAEAVLAREKREQGVAISNRGGWHSGQQLLQWPELRFAGLRHIFRSAVCHMVAATTGVETEGLDISFDAWANVNRTGAFNSNHIHPYCHWSGVLYVQTIDFSEDPLGNAGALVLQDPRSSGQGMLRLAKGNRNRYVSPRTGIIVMFPSWMLHSVNPFTLETVRISIAFNARVDSFLDRKGGGYED